MASVLKLISGKIVFIEYFSVDFSFKKGISYNVLPLANWFLLYSYSSSRQVTRTASLSNYISKSMQKKKKKNLTLQNKYFIDR